MSVEYNWDALGVSMRPINGKMGNVIDAQYQAAVEWVREFLFNVHGQTIDVVKLEPNLQIWQFYDGKDMIASVEHSYMDRLKVALDILDSYNAEMEV